MEETTGREPQPAGSGVAGPSADGPGPVGGWAFDVTTGEVRWSPQMFEIHGLAPDHEVTLETIIGATHHADAETVARERRSWEKSVSPFRARPRIVRSDGVVRTVEVCGWRDPFCGEDAPRVVGTARDVTDEVGALGARRTALLAAEERARRRIAITIHDDAIAALDGAALRIECERERLSSEEDHLGELVGEIRAAAQRLRLVLGNLMPPAAVGDLTNAVRTYARTLFADVQTRVQVGGDPGELDDELRVVAYRAVQEALRNVRRHAEAGSVVVDIARMASALVITVRDDGVGLSSPGTAAPLTHGGLRLLAEQIETVGGRLRLGTGLEGRGTSVEVTLPVSC